MIPLERLPAKNKDWEATRKSLSPTNQTELRSFLRRQNVYRRYVPSLARVSAPQKVQTIKKQPFELDLNVAELHAFQNFQERRMSPPIFALPRHGQQYAINTEAYEYQIVCALLKQKPNEEKLHVGYWSSIPWAAEKNYYITGKKRFTVT